MTERDALPISALQHLVFCERQFALIHVEREWAENRLTAEGNAIHERVHRTSHEVREGTKILRSVPLVSARLSIRGVADIVEVRTGGARVPVEYKRGKPKTNDCDRVQLCAQALCLEEMLGIEVSWGELFYGERQRRTVVAIDQRLREVTEAAIERAHELMREGMTPLVDEQPKCQSCSLVDVCMPRLASRSSATAYLTQQSRRVAGS